MTIESLLLAIGNIGLVLAAAIGGGWLLYSRLRQIPPSTYAEMEMTLADMNRQMGELRQQQAADHTEMRRLRGEIGRIDAADGLVFEMGLGRNVRGDSTEDRARSLISAAQRRGRLTELIELCRRERPNGGF